MLLQPSKELSDLYENRTERIRLEFSFTKKPDELYELLIRKGKALPEPQKNICTPAHLVEGCQSLVYITTSLQKDLSLQLEIFSEALISKGLASLLLDLYQGQPALLLLLYPPVIVQELGLPAALTPGRSNGLASMYAKMKQDALLLFLQQHAATIGAR